MPGDAPKLGLAAALAASLSGAATAAEPPRLGGSVFEAAAKPHGIQPELLYAVSLYETRRQHGPDHVMPWPWALRTPEGGAWYKSRKAAVAALRQALKRWPRKRIDVGIAQINLGWQSKRYDRAVDLLDPATNLRVSASVLAEALASTDDPTLAVGRYHSWTDTERARNYGTRVLGIVGRITELKAAGKTAAANNSEQHQWGNSQWTN